MSRQSEGHASWLATTVRRGAAWLGFVNITEPQDDRSEILAQPSSSAHTTLRPESEDVYEDPIYIPTPPASALPLLRRTASQSTGRSQTATPEPEFAISRIETAPHVAYISGAITASIRASKAVEQREDYSSARRSNVQGQRRQAEKRREVPSATMSLQQPRRKQNHGAFVPHDSISKPRRPDERLSWMTNNYGTPFPEKKATAAAKRSIGATAPVSDDEKPASSFRPRRTQASSPAFPESAPKRQKLDRSHDDGLKGRSTSFQAVDAMMKPKAVRKVKSRSLSRHSSQQGGSQHHGQASPYFGNSHGGTPLQVGEADQEMVDDDLGPVKPVHSPRYGTSGNGQGAAQRLVDHCEFLNRSTPNVQASTAGVIHQSSSPASSDRTMLDDGPDTERSGSDIQDRESFEPEPVSDPLSQDSEMLIERLPLASDHSSLTTAAKSPNPPYRNPVPGRQSSPIKQEKIQVMKTRMRDRFSREGPRHASTDQTDELQQSPPQAPPPLPERRKSRLSSPQPFVDAEDKKPKSTAFPVSHALRDGFEKEDPAPPRSRQKETIRHTDQTKFDFDEDQGVVKGGMLTETIVDCGRVHEGVNLMKNISRRNFSYHAAGKESIIPLNTITKATWGHELFVRFEGPMAQKTRFDVLIKFASHKAWTQFMSACNLMRLRSSLHQKDAWKEDKDVKLAQVLQKKLRERSANSVYGREEIDVVTKRVQKPNAVASNNAQPRTKVRDRMQDDHDDKSQPTKATRRGTRTSLQANGRPSDDDLNSNFTTREHSRKASPRPLVPPSQGKELYPRWSKSLVYPPGAARNSIATVEFNDLERLDPDEFLNDNLIAFGLRRALQRAPPEVQDQVHIFNTYFYSSLTKNVKRGINYEAVKKWTLKLAKHKDLFQYNYIVVPINESYHWYVAIVCNVDRIRLSGADGEEAASSRPEPAHESSPAMARTPRQQTSVADSSALTIERKTSQMSLNDPADDSSQHEVNGIKDDVHKQDDTRDSLLGSFRDDEPSSHRKKARQNEPVIITLDSFGGRHPEVTRHIKDYLHREADDKRNSVIAEEPSGITAQGIPLQHNFSDCGLYAIAYVEQFLKGPEDFVARVISREMNELEHWPDFDASTLRDNCRDIVMAEGRTQNGIPLEQKQAAALTRSGITDIRASAVRSRLPSVSLPMHDHPANEERKATPARRPATKVGNDKWGGFSDTPDTISGSHRVHNIHDGTGVDPQREGAAVEEEPPVSEDELLEGIYAYSSQTDKETEPSRGSNETEAVSGPNTRSLDNISFPAGFVDSHPRLREVFRQAQAGQSTGHQLDGAVDEHVPVEEHATQVETHNEDADELTHEEIRTAEAALDDATHGAIPTEAAIDEEDELADTQQHVPLRRELSVEL